MARCAFIYAGCLRLVEKAENETIFERSITVKASKIIWTLFYLNLKLEVDLASKIRNNSVKRKIKLPILD